MSPQRCRVAVHLVVLLLLAAPVAAQTYVPALVSGQSNACLLSAHLPPGSHLLYCAWGQSITAWDWTDPEQPAAKTFIELTTAHEYDFVIDWQGESDALMPTEEYRARKYAVLVQAAVRPNGTIRPILLVEIATRPGREHITGVHRWFAAHPSVAFIPTADLPRDGLSDHFTPEAYATVAQRLIACVQTACWRDQ